MNSHIKKHWLSYLAVFIFVGFLIAYFSIASFNAFAKEFWEVIWSEDEDRITAWFKSFGLWGPMLIIAFMILQMFLIVFPTWLPMIIAALGYGGWWGFCISMVAVFISATFGYYIGEQLSATSENFIIGKKKFKKLSAFMKEFGFWAVVLFRISPFLTNDGISFAAGLIKMGYKRYITASMIGITPLAAAIAYFGKDFETLKGGLYWIGGGGVLIYIIYIVLKIRHQKELQQAK